RSGPTSRASTSGRPSSSTRAETAASAARSTRPRRRGGRAGAATDAASGIPASVHPFALNVTSPIKIDIWSDIACPWCYIGKRHLEGGLAALGDDAPEVEIEYHSFELAPDTPLDFEGSEVDFLAGHKGIPVEQARMMIDRVTGVAAQAGLDYDYDALQHTKTLKAHELLHFAKEQGKQLELSERLFRAYFTEGRHVGRTDELVELAAEVGLDADAAREALES